MQSATAISNAASNHRGAGSLSLLALSKHTFKTTPAVPAGLYQPLKGGASHALPRLLGVPTSETRGEQLEIDSPPSNSHSITHSVLHKEDATSAFSSGLGVPVMIHTPVNLYGAFQRSQVQPEATNPASPAAHCTTDRISVWLTLGGGIQGLPSFSSHSFGDGEQVSNISDHRY